jgi:5-methylcytosine-specific restriction endonuclease McrA
MPYKPKTVSRPWIQKMDYNSIPGQGRIIVNMFYQSRQWKRFRKMFINGFSTHLGTSEPHPNCLCIECLRDGRLTATHTIDHIKPINPSNSYDTMNGRYGEPLTWENCQPLCEHCNAVKTGKEIHGK